MIRDYYTYIIKSDVNRILGGNKRSGFTPPKNCLGSPLIDTYKYTTHTYMNWDPFEDKDQFTFRF